MRKVKAKRPIGRVKLGGTTTGALNPLPKIQAAVRLKGWIAGDHRRKAGPLASPTVPIKVAMEGRALDVAEIGKSLPESPELVCICLRELRRRGYASLPETTQELD
jgi:hypothetical protein